MLARLRAWVMLMAVGLVLPTAGGAHLICTIGCPEFGKPGGCVETNGDCCPGETGPDEKPDCLAVMDVMPEALQPDALGMPVAPVVGVSSPDVAAGVLAAGCGGAGRMAENAMDHGPPLYLVKLALLL
jgi:hypothetical protein